MKNNALSVPEESVHSSGMNSTASVSNAGTQHPQPIFVLGELKNENLLVLIDSGASYNIIDQATVSKFGLPVTQCNKVQFMMVNRDKIEATGRCRALTILIQGHFVTADYYVVPVAAQLILGIEWLETLGPIETDYKQLTMTFKVEGVPRTFKGLRQGSVATLTNKEVNGLQDSTTWKSPTNLIQWQDQAYNQLQLAKEKYKEDLNRAYQSAEKLLHQPCSAEERATREMQMEAFKRMLEFLSKSKSHLANYPKQDFCHKFSVIIGYLNRIRQHHASATEGSQPSQTRQQLNTTTHLQLRGDNIHTSMQDPRSRHVSGHQSQYQNTAPSYIEARQTNSIPKNCLTGIGATQPSYHNVPQKSLASAPLCTQNKSRLANVGILPNFKDQSNFQQEAVGPLPSLSRMDSLGNFPSTRMQVNSSLGKVESATNPTTTPLPSNPTPIPSLLVRQPENNQTKQQQKVMPHQLRRVTHENQQMQAEKLHGTKAEDNLRNRLLNHPIGQNRQSSFTSQRSDIEQPTSIPDLIRATKKQKIEFAAFLFQEIELINKRLIETVVHMIHRTTNFTHGTEVVILQFTFTAVGQKHAPNLHPSILLPDLVLQVLVQSDYPNLSPVILDRNPQPWSGNDYADALWNETLQKFDRAICTFPQPVSIGQMAEAWDRSAHDACREYAESLGGGSLSSSIYGIWEKYIAT